MATSVYPATGGFSGITELDNFIPEIWSDEIIASYKANLVLGALVTRFNHNGKKGDTINIPAPTRISAATVKAENTAVTVTGNAEGVVAISIDKHYHAGRMLEDRADEQGLRSWREFVTDDMGFILSKQVDTDLHDIGPSFQGGTAGDKAYDAGVIGSNGSTLYTDGADNGAAITDAGIRRVCRTLDDADVPQGNRYLVIPPVEKENILGIPRFTEQAFVGEVGSANSIRNGRIGSIYGVDVYVSTNCPTTTNTNNRASLMLHRSALALVTQMSIRVQMQYQLDFLGTLMVADTLYGVAELRDDAAVAIISPA